MIKLMVSLSLAALMLLSAIYHIIKPKFYEPLIPAFIPSQFANIVTAIAEGVVGIALLLPTYRTWGGFGFFLLMLGFLPLHTWDLLKAKPAFGSKKAAAIRLVLQFVLIYAGWWVWKS
ncbi:MAG: hypothetical protein AAF847_00270 [Bacteroidota bacterium]